MFLGVKICFTLKPDQAGSAHRLAALPLQTWTAVLRVRPEGVVVLFIFMVIGLVPLWNEVSHNNYNVGQKASLFSK